MKYVTSTVVIGSNGRPVVTRGYTDLGGGLRLYDDQVQIGLHGQHIISKGKLELCETVLDQYDRSPYSYPTSDYSGVEGESSLKGSWIS